MRETFDARVVPPEVVRFLRELTARAPFELAGGAALSGVYLGHRLSKDVDLFCRDSAAQRALVAALGDAARAAGGSARIVQDAGTFVRAEVTVGPLNFDADLVVDTAPALDTPRSIDGVRVQGLADLRASKLTCLLSRSEPRDLVDVLFLERAGFPADADLPLAAQKDTGVDPGVMGWLLGQFPLSPLPQMLTPLSEEELKAYRDELRERFRKLATK